MLNAAIKKARKKIRSLRKIVPPVLILPGMFVLGFFVLFTVFGYLIKGLIIIGGLLFFRKYLLKTTGLNTLGGKTAKKKRVRGSKIAQKQPGRMTIVIPHK